MFCIDLLYYLTIKAARPHEGFPINQSRYLRITHRVPHSMYTYSHRRTEEMKPNIMAILNRIVLKIDLPTLMNKLWL